MTSKSVCHNFQAEYSTFSVETNLCQHSSPVCRLLDFEHPYCLQESLPRLSFLYHYLTGYWDKRCMWWPPNVLDGYHCFIYFTMELSPA